MWRGHSCPMPLSFRGIEHPAWIVGQDCILRAGFQPALVGLFTGDPGGLPNRQTQRVPLPTCPATSVEFPFLGKLSGIGHSCLPCRDFRFADPCRASRHAFAVATKCPSQSVGMSARPSIPGTDRDVTGVNHLQLARAHGTASQPSRRSIVGLKAAGVYD